MASHDGKVTEFFSSTVQAANTILETVEEEGFIHVFSHLDADGIAAAGIIGKTLFRLGAKFRIRITQWVEARNIAEMLAGKPQLVIFSDLGNDYFDIVNKKGPVVKTVILDHHQIGGKEPSNCIHVNPHLHQIDGARDISGSGVTYLVAKALDERNTDTAPLAVIGALGDSQDKYDQRKLGGINERIVEDAVNAGLLAVEKDLIFFGRETRPIHKTLAFTNDPFIPGISGEEDESYAFLAGLNIKPKQDDKWRALRDLSKEEKQRLCSALADTLVSKGLHTDVTKLVGHVYILNSEDAWTPLRDAREFAVLLNGTGRMGKPGLGVAVCMGDRSVNLKNANRVLAEYRKTISEYLGGIREQSERIKEMANIRVVHGTNLINHKIIGTIASILSTTLPNPEKPLIAYTNIENESSTKISARTIVTVTNRGVNLGEVVQVAAEKCLGKGGGHNIAAGAQVPSENTHTFLELVNELVGNQLRGKID